MDLIGRIQLTSSIPANRKKEILNVSTLNPGIYLLKVTDGKKVIGVEKMVVE
ncbi:MAG: T9SS type A sorting domain-containing protein [Bacteroidetes bacterium]|nr:T9SS type A sorting domain-containing protein [Bacteroidota bacterium]